MVESCFGFNSLIKYVTLAGVGVAFGIYLSHNLSKNNSKLPPVKKTIEEPREYCSISGEECCTTNQAPLHT
ncbi:Hypothetical protein SRAE_2000355400 [Strongyloides ratti]|uniref:Uncharacterized protein n=1 Tax=Strongyloides ratti TaxID=34506 RepID=A0A090LMY9_STRRB|nr:Hypothetical protein SRAE_2000355400 [Strongyloides ratti]CEF68900.1 Hypothetical protein SRAE_2000355400 [Strongyloides ratti]